MHYCSPKQCMGKSEHSISSSPNWQLRRQLLQRWLPDDDSLHAHLPQDSGKHIHNGAADHLNGDNENRGTGVDAQCDQLQGRAPHPHAAKHCRAVHATPHKRHGNANQNHKDVIGHQLAVFVADAKAAEEFRGDICVRVFLDACIKFQLQEHGTE